MYSLGVHMSSFLDVLLRGQEHEAGQVMALQCRQKIKIYAIIGPQLFATVSRDPSRGRALVRVSVETAYLAGPI
jgi:hypothetical protein